MIIREGSHDYERDHMITSHLMTRVMVRGVGQALKIT